MEIIDDINRLLGDDLEQTIQPGARLKIAASCFSIYAFEALKSELEKIDSLQFIFTPDFQTAQSRYRSEKPVSGERLMGEFMPTLSHGLRDKFRAPVHGSTGSPRTEDGLSVTFTSFNGLRGNLGSAACIP